MLPNPQETSDLVTFAKEILNGKLQFLCSVKRSLPWTLSSAKRVNQKLFGKFSLSG